MLKWEQILKRHGQEGRFVGRRTTAKVSFAVFVPEAAVLALTLIRRRHDVCQPISQWLSKQLPGLPFYLQFFHFWSFAQHKRSFLVLAAAAVAHVRSS